MAKDLYEKHKLNPNTLNKADLSELQSIQAKANATPEVAFAKFCVQKAQVQLEAIPYGVPEGLETYSKYPNMNPAGKHCVEGMDFVARTEAIASLAPMYGDQVQQTLDGLKDHNGTMRSQILLGDSLHKVNVVDRAMKLSDDPQVTQVLQAQRAQLLTSPAITEMENTLVAMEHLVGIRQGPVPDQAKEAMAQAGVPLSQETLDQAGKRVNSPTTMDFHFESYDAIQMHALLVHPDNWGKAQQKIWKDVDKTAHPHSVDSYARATVRDKLDNVFDGIESRNFSGLSRENLITVEGKSIDQMMKEDFIARNPNNFEIDKSYKTWKQENPEQLKGIVSSYLATALTTGHKVEAYIPDEKGNLPKEPTALQQTGYRPSMKSPVHMNRWESFWSKHGFYQEKLARMEQQMEDKAIRENIESRLTDPAREVEVAAQRELTDALVHAQELKYNYVNGSTNVKGESPAALAYTRGEPKLSTLGTIGGFRLDRTTGTSMVTLNLLAEGHPLEQVLDSNYLRDEKFNGFNQLVDWAKSDTPKAQQYATTAYTKGMERLVSELDRVYGMDKLADCYSLVEKEPEQMSNLRCLLGDCVQDTKLGGFLVAKENMDSPHVKKELDSLYSRWEKEDASGMSQQEKISRHETQYNEALQQAGYKIICDSQPAKDTQALSYALSVGTDRLNHQIDFLSNPEKMSGMTVAGIQSTQYINEISNGNPLTADKSHLEIAVAVAGLEQSNFSATNTTLADTKLSAVNRLAVYRLAQEGKLSTIDGASMIAPDKAAKAMKDAVNTRAKEVKENFREKLGIQSNAKTAPRKEGLQKPAHEAAARTK